MNKRPGLGLLLPINRGATGYFNTGFDALTQVKSNLINLVLTKKGERVMQPSFGCNIHNLLFEAATPETLAQFRGTIEEAAQIWIPVVSIENVSAERDEDTNQLLIEITFSLKTNLQVTDTIIVAI